MSDIYDDPDLQDPTDTGDFPPTLKFLQIGDRLRGVVADVSKFQGAGDPAIKYSFVEVKAKQAGAQQLLPRAEIIAGAKNLRGQLMTLKPRKGDTVDIELVEFRPSNFASPAKIYKINVERAEADAALSIGPADDDKEEDLFA
jgi:hypothetical protein